MNTTVAKDNRSHVGDTKAVEIENRPDLYIEDYHTGIKGCFVGLGVISFVTSIVAITALRRTRKVPPSVRFLATALLSFDCSHIVLTTFRKFMINPLYNTTIHSLGMITVMLAFVTVGIMTVERYWLIHNPMDYLRICTQRLLHGIAFTLWVSLTMLFLFVRYVVCYVGSPSINVFQKAGFCNHTSTIFYFGLLCSMVVLSVVCYARIFQIVRQKNSHIPGKTAITTIRSFQSTSLVFVYLFMIICTTAGFFVINISVRLNKLSVTATRISLDTVTVLNSLVDPFLYVIWFKECQMEVLKMFSFLNEGLRVKVAKMRMEVFDIIPYDKFSA